MSARRLNFALLPERLILVSGSSINILPLRGKDRWRVESGSIRTSTENGKISRMVDIHRNSVHTETSSIS